MSDTSFATAIVDHSMKMAPLQMPDPTFARPTNLDGIVAYRIAQAATLEGVALCLLRLLGGGFAVWRDGRLIETRARVDQIRGLRIDIRTREHGPPHFHVSGADVNASFSIRDCELLAGHVDGNSQRLIKVWHSAARPLLVRVWNETRPADCPVGPIIESP
jgi:hypothetical protein